MSLNRRQFLLFFGATAGTVAMGSLPNSPIEELALGVESAAATQGLGFKPVKLPMPVTTASVAADKQATEFAIAVCR